MHADYIAIISQKNKVCYVWLNIVEINNINIQLKDIKFLSCTESKYASARSPKLVLLEILGIFDRSFQRFLTSGALALRCINATGFRGNGGGVGPFSASDFWLNT